MKKTEDLSLLLLNKWEELYPDKVTVVNTEYTLPIEINNNTTLITIKNPLIEEYQNLSHFIQVTNPKNNKATIVAYYTLQRFLVDWYGIVDEQGNKIKDKEQVINTLLKKGIITFNLTHFLLTRNSLDNEVIKLIQLRLALDTSDEESDKDYYCSKCTEKYIRQCGLISDDEFRKKGVNPANFKKQKYPDGNYYDRCPVGFIPSYVPWAISQLYNFGKNISLDNCTPFTFTVYPMVAVAYKKFDRLF